MKAPGGVEKAVQKVGSSAPTEVHEEKRGENAGPPPRRSALGITRSIHALTL